jgi:hypothetical protein
MSQGNSVPVSNFWICSKVVVMLTVLSKPSVKEYYACQDSYNLTEPQPNVTIQHLPTSSHIKTFLSDFALFHIHFFILSPSSRLYFERSVRDMLQNVKPLAQ